MLFHEAQKLKKQKESSSSTEEVKVMEDIRQVN